MMGCMVSRGLWGLDCANTPLWLVLASNWHGTQLCVLDADGTASSGAHLRGGNGLYAIIMMTLLQTDRVILQHLQPLLAASIQTNSTEMWVQVRAPCCMVASSNEALLYVCPSHISVF